MELSHVKAWSVAGQSVAAVSIGGAVVWEAPAAYTNLLSLAVAADGSAYNGGLGYKSGWRLNSSREEKELAGMCCTGFLPVSPGDTIRVKNITVAGTSGGYIFYFDADRSTCYTSVTQYPSTTLVDPVDGVYTFTVPTEISSVGYMRITIGEISEETVITANEPI